MAWNKLEILGKYIERGWPIFPLQWLVGGRCSCRNSKCGSPGKHPKVKGGFQAASTDLKVIAEWDRKWPRANWGMRTGSLDSGGSGILVVDLDTKNQGPQTWEMLVMDYPDREDTVSVHSGGGGTHLWYKLPEGQKIGCSAGALGPGVDIRGDGGYIIVPPSCTQDSYRFILKPSETSIQELPQWLLEELKQLGLRAGEGPGSDGPVRQGTRHNAARVKALSLRNFGCTEADILACLQVYRDDWFEKGDHPVSDSELADLAHWAHKQPKNHAETDLGNMARFVDQHRETVRYCPQWKQWVVWDGVVWKKNARGAAFNKAYLTVQSIKDEARRIPDEKAREDRWKHAIRSEADPRMNSIIRHARNRLEIDANEFDQHPDLLTVSNGVIDLRSGELRHPDPTLRMTRLVNLDYDPQAACPQWLDFLALVSGGDQGLVDFLQLAAGYSLTGRTGEQLFFFLYGPGASGKTTFMEGLKTVMGDYFTRIRINALLNSPNPGKGPTPEVAKLEGVRLVLTSEVPELTTLNEALIKDLTGGDSLTARPMYGHPVNFDPTHKLWLIGNYRPDILGTDEGIWRRFRLVPFTQQIPEGIRKNHDQVKEMLRSEAPGILAWTVAGSIRWYRSNLSFPYVVKKATDEFRKEQDVVGNFLRECCRVGEDLRVLKSDLYRAWRQWAEQNGEYDFANRSKSWFTRRLQKEGFVLGGNGKNYMLGLGLK